MHVVICGAGVIGASVAYFLSRRGIGVTVVERSGVACAASGKSGGFLALDWCDGGPLASLARRSFQLHAELAMQPGAPQAGAVAGVADGWGYRRLATYGGMAGAAARRRPRSNGPVDWVSDQVALERKLGTVDSTAQVHPRLFTAAMIQAAEANGADLRIGEVTGVIRDPGSGRTRGVEINGGETVAGDAVVIAMGPWSILASRWIPLPAVFGLKGHSLVFETGDRVPPEALFLEFEEPGGDMQSPEVFPRADGTTYVCAISSEAPLPIDPAEVGPDPGALDRLERMCRSLSPVLASSRIVAAQACFRPVTRDGLPLIGPVAGVPGAYVATGHSVWGILNAPATGEAMAELIVDGAAGTVDLSPFDPGRGRPFDPARLQVGAG